MLSQRTSFIINKYMLKRPDEYGLIHFEGGPAAQVRAVYWTLIRRWETEICQRCGRRVSPHTGSWWHADEALWAKVMVEHYHVVCPPCFSEAASAMGLLICYHAIDGDPVQLAPWRLIGERRVFVPRCIYPNVTPHPRQGHEGMIERIGGTADDLAWVRFDDGEVLPIAVVLLHAPGAETEAAVARATLVPYGP